MSLRLQLNNQALTHSALSASDDDDDDDAKTEKETMREKVNELTRQKMQLSEHIAMVAAENRQLWSRLSKLTKENETLEKLTELQTSPSHQNLIRSKTFTQNSPNPKLREKFDKNSDPEDLVVDVAKFAISENYAVGDLEGVKRLLDDMGDTKVELIRQQNALKVALASLKEKQGWFSSSSNSLTLLTTTLTADLFKFLFQRCKCALHAPPPKRTRQMALRPNLNEPKRNRCPLRTVLLM